MPRLPITNVISIYEFQRSGQTESYSPGPIYQNVNTCISPTGTDMPAAYGEGPSYQLFEIFIYDITVIIKQADKIVTESGLAYYVDGMPFVINNQYLSFIRMLARQVV